MSFSTPYFNLGNPLIKRFCENVPCSGFESSDIPQTFTKSLFENVSFVWVPDYNTKIDDLDKDIPSSGFNAQFDPIVILSELGMNTYVALDLPLWFVKDLHPNIRTLKSLNQSFARQEAGRLLMSTPEVNANRLHRIMNRSGVLSKESEHVRQIMWVMGLERTVRQIKDEKMRVIGNVHHSHKQFYAPGSTPTTARLPEEQIRDTDSMKLSDVIFRKRNLVLVDRDAFHLDIYTIAEQVRARIPDVEFIWLNGMTTDQVRETYAQAKLTIDSFMLGGEAINFESAMWYCLPKELEAIILTMEFHNMWLPSFVRVRAIPSSLLTLGEMSRFVVTPLTKGHQFTVISKPRTLILGRDILNAHGEASYGGV